MKYEFLWVTVLYEIKSKVAGSFTEGGGEGRRVCMSVG